MKTQKPENVVKMPKPMRARVLRNYVRLAHREQGSCWVCNQLIMGGDEYEAWVTIWTEPGRRCFYVRKEHLDCHNHPDDDDEVRRHEEDERTKSNNAYQQLAA